jgi:hypothetical protein
LCAAVADYLLFVAAFLAVFFSETVSLFETVLGFIAFGRACLGS